MKTYIGVKVIEAEPAGSPATLGAEQRPGYRVVYPDGYRSWSPKDVFEEAYVEVPAESANAILDCVRENISLVHDAIRAAEQRGYDRAGEA